MWCVIYVAELGSRVVHFDLSGSQQLLFFTHARERDLMLFRAILCGGVWLLGSMSTSGLLAEVLSVSWLVMWFVWSLDSITVGHFSPAGCVLPL